jgi:hypothetical protein
MCDGDVDMSDDLERLMSQLQPTRATHADSRQQLATYNHDGVWTAQPGHNESANGILYFPKHHEGLFDKMKLPVPAWDETRVPYTEIPKLDYKTRTPMYDKDTKQPLYRKVVKWDEVPRDVLLQMYFYEYFFRVDNEHKLRAKFDAAKKHIQNSGGGHGGGRGGRGGGGTGGERDIHIHFGADKSSGQGGGNGYNHGRKHNKEHEGHDRGRSQSEARTPTQAPHDRRTATYRPGDHAPAYASGTGSG